MIDINFTLFGFKVHIYKPYPNTTKAPKKAKNTVPPGSQNITSAEFTVV